MKLNIKNVMVLGATLAASSFLISCDSSSGGGGDGGGGGGQKIEFPVSFQEGDEISFAGETYWLFKGPDTYTSSLEQGGSGLDQILGAYKPNASGGRVFLNDAGTTKESAEVTFQDRIDVLLADFDSILRTIPYERTRMGESLTPEDLQAFEELINEEVADTGEVIVSYDEQRNRLMLFLTHDVTLNVTSDPDSFIKGMYSGDFVATERGAIITFKAPTAEERETYRMTKYHRLPKVSNSEADLPTVIAGAFTWTLSGAAPDPEPEDGEAVDG